MSLILQFCVDGRGEIWQDLTRLFPGDVEEAQQAAARLSKFGPLLWRIVRNDETRQRLSSFNGLRWQVASVEPTVEQPMPWFSPRAHFGKPDLDTGFVPTVPLVRPEGE